MNAHREPKKIIFKIIHFESIGSTCTRSCKSLCVTNMHDRLTNTLVKYAS